MAQQGHYAIWRYYPAWVFDNPVQHCDHIIMPQIGFVRAFLGPSWLPDWAEVCYPRDEQSGQLEEILGVPVVYGVPHAGVAFDASLLRTGPERQTRALTLIDVEASEAPRATENFTWAMATMIVMRLLEGRTNIEGSASMAGPGVQTIQRELRRDGLTYRTLPNRARTARAEALLAETDQSIIQIAVSLGYADHANFTRAFRSQTGIAPSSYRQRAGAAA